MPEKSESSNLRLEIKKYPNRRYYDATHSRHLTLDEIRSLIRDGYDIRVTDARTSADITAQVLAQIILERETGKIESFPVPLLVRLIRVNDQLIKDFINKYFNQAFQSFLDYQQQLEQQIRKAHGLAADYPGIAEWTKTVFGPFASAFDHSPKASDSRPSGAAPIDDPSRQLRELVQDLQKQVAELKAQASRGKTGKRASRR